MYSHKIKHLYINHNSILTEGKKLYAYRLYKIAIMCTSVYIVRKIYI